MMRTFAGKAAALAALVGFVIVAILASSGYALVSTIRRADEALSTYSDELILAWALQEAHERAMASGRGYLLAHDEWTLTAFEKAEADGKAVLAKLHARVTSPEGIALLDRSDRAFRTHEQSLRSVLAMKASAEELGQAWRSEVLPKANEARAAMDAFIHHKHVLYDQSKARAFSAQRRAGWMMGATAMGVLLLGIFAGIPIIRSVKEVHAAEQKGREAAEKERAFFLTLLNQLPLATIAADPTGRILHVSTFAQGMLEKADHLWALAQTALARAVRGETIREEELPASSQQIYSVTAGPIRNEKGAVIAAVVALVEISERKRREKERELFIGVLGHDLRNPLNAITLAADSLIRRADVPDVARKPAARIASSAQRMNRLIGELLDFARSQHGVIPIKPEPCELSDIASEVVAEFRLVHPESNIRIEAEGRCEGRCDPARMTQVFQNLVGNAIEHGAADAPITVQTGCDGGSVWATVTNRGDPISPENRSRIFEPFRTSPTSKGLGLGLYIARAIVEAHGGTIAVESNGSETTFAIKLPFHPTDTRRDENQPSA